MAFTVSGASRIAGARPALAGINASEPYLRANASAIWLRHALPIHRNRTRLRVSLTNAPGTAHVLANRGSARDERSQPDAAPPPPAPHPPGTAPAPSPPRPRAG